MPGSYFRLVQSALPGGPLAAATWPNRNRDTRSTHVFTLTTFSLPTPLPYSLCFLTTHKHRSVYTEADILKAPLRMIDWKLVQIAQWHTHSKKAQLLNIKVNYNYTQIKNLHCTSSCIILKKKNIHSRVSYRAYFSLKISLELVWDMAELSDSADMLCIWYS